MNGKGKVYRRAAGLALVAFLLVLTACGTTSQLSQFKKHWDKQEFSWIAEQKVTCTASDEGCNQLHLIKGDACYRLAKQGQASVQNYDCAATHLGLGIEQTQQWQMEKFNLNRPQTYENLCEALRDWRDLEKGSKAEQINQGLLNTAQGFLVAEPGNLAAVYFLENARYAKLGPCLLHPERCPSLCNDLTFILGDLSPNASRSKGTKYEPNYEVLIKEITKEKELARCP
jgi:hypothetical protein